MLLGKDDVILNVAPTYVTNALVRKVNMDCYDDREIINNKQYSIYPLNRKAELSVPDLVNPVGKRSLTDWAHMGGQYFDNL